MSKSYRLRTQVGVDRQVNVQLEQDFESLEILSLKIRSEDIYTRMCADYGVVVGRVYTNNGYGIPNAKLSIFIPLDEIDQQNEIISSLYPYTSIEDVNEDGYRYNLLPYNPQHSGHQPIGTFPSRFDVLTNPALIEVYDKYYKFTVKTNGSGDFMIFGVPVGSHTLVMNLDLSDMGPFSMSPQDLVRIGRATQDQLKGTEFPVSSDLSTLPQFVNINQTIDVRPFWGDPELCQIDIARRDFNLSEVGITIQPTALFMGSLVTNQTNQAISRNCIPPSEMGDLCNLNAGPGDIIAVRQTIFQDSQGRPILEQAPLPQGGKVIDEDGTWLLEVPMNLDYVTTNEFGEQVLSQDPTVGVPTQGKYRFKIKWGQSPNLELSETRRAYFLVPNVKEYGWDSSNVDPAYNLNTGSTEYQEFIGSYYFGLDWSGYTNPTAAINCEDTFYNFQYNKVYTVSGLVDQYYKGLNRGNFIGIKEITDNTCADDNYKFPATDGVRNFDFLFFVVNFFLTILAPLGFVLIPLLHFIAQYWPITKWFIRIGLVAWFGWLSAQSFLAAINLLINWPPPVFYLLQNIFWGGVYLYVSNLAARISRPLTDTFSFKQLQLPMLSYPLCEACECEVKDLTLEFDNENPWNIGGESQSEKLGSYFVYSRNSNSLLIPSNDGSLWGQLTGDPNQQPPQGIDPDLYPSGTQTKRNEKYQADVIGFGYGLAGYPIVKPFVNPNNKETREQNIGRTVGTPVVRTYSKSEFKGIVSRDVTLSQSLNLMNIRERYFEQSNIIQTTINNPGYPSQPFTDNVLILLCRPETGLSDGDLLTFTSPDSILDVNLTGQTTQNQFGSFSITGTSQTSPTGIYNTTVSYIQPNGAAATSNLYLVSPDSDRNYEFKTGLEYFQVITKYKAIDAFNLLSPSNSLLRKYIFDKQQKLFYYESNGTLNSVTLNSLTSIGDDWKNTEIYILTRGVDPWTVKQEINYDLSKLFGYSLGSNTVSKTGQYHLNVPIQPNSGSGNWYTNYKTPESHTTLYNVSPVFHKPFNFQPDPTKFVSIQTKSLSFYSSLDKSSLNFIPYQSSTDKLLKIFLNSNYLVGGSLSDTGQVIQQSRFFNTEYQGVIEGGSFIACSNVENLETLDISDSRLYAPSYLNLTQTITYVPAISNAKLVLRSDRLPTSDVIQKPQLNLSPAQFNNGSFALYQNENFATYVVLGQGLNNAGILYNTSFGLNSSTIEPSGLDNNFDKVLETFSCEGMVPLKCYTTDSEGALVVLDPCPANENPVRVEQGCYDILTSIKDENGKDNYLRTIPQDIQNFFEWLQRFRLTFAICRGVFSHTFVNSWVNGTLFAFPFRNKPTFGINNQLQVRSVIPVPTPSGVVQKVSYSFCADTIAFEPKSNNFYYRSSPWDGSKFIGKKAPLETGTIIGGLQFQPLNNYNLLFPTTILDMGPKYFWTKDVILSANYYGYQMDKMTTSSWNDVSNLVQIFTVSRLVNVSFLESILSTGDAALSGYFSRDGQRVDGDYAQMLQINSQYGVSPLNEGNYVDDPAIPGDNPIYISSDNQGNPLFGVFYNSYPSDRDLISPRRIDRNTTGMILTADYLGTKSQLVPFYEWQNNGWAPTAENSIFGNDKNTWYSRYNTLLNIGDNILSAKYQELDRLNAPFFLGNNSAIQNQQGFIFQRNGMGEYDAQNTVPNNFTTLTGAPWYFYFGLKVGRNAMDKFRELYIGTE